MDKPFYNVNELPAAARSVVETLVGHPLRDDQQLYVVALDRAAEPAIDERQAAWKELQSLMAVMRENAKKSGLSVDEIDRLIDNECDAVRYGGG